MFDGLFEVIAKVLSTFYDLIPNYAVAIALLTLVVMVLTTPFTLKGTRSMIQMQRLQPEMRRLQLKYKDDRQKLNEELMAFYKENQLNPLGGCLPLLLQAPIFMLLFQLIQGLTRMGDDGTFDPRHLDEASKMYERLDGTDQMLSFGVDLAESASRALGDGFVHGLPHVAMVAIVAVSSYYQQKQIQGRNPDAEIPPQQKMLMRIMPLMFVFFAFVSPAALVVYFVVSNLYRIGMQHYITRTLYHGEDSLGAQAAKAAKEAKALAAEEGGPDLLPKLGRKRAVETTATDTSADVAAAPAKSARSTSSTPSGGRPAPTSRTSGANRSKKKKKRR
ncbi:MAG: YidC/Oxa1 family membrane protein insertase [Acidimicrobiia bacterium]